MVRIVTFFLVVLFFIIQCGDTGTDDCSVLNNPGVELITPRGTEVFSMGESVAVRWKVDPDKVMTIKVAMSTISPDGPFYSIFAHSIPVPLEGGKQCMDTVWVIGEEPGHIFTYSPPQTVYLRVEDYNNSDVNNVSGMITINE